MAVAGEPLAYRHAVVLYAAQSVKGTPATPNLSCGAALVRYQKHNNITYIEQPGTADYVAAKGGEVWTDWECRWEEVQTGIKTLLLKVNRVAGVCPYVTLGFGWLDDAGSPSGEVDVIPDCKVDYLELGFDASNGRDAPLTGTLAGIGAIPAVDTTPLSPVLSTTTPWMVDEAVLTRATLSYESKRWTTRIANSLSRDHVIYGAAPATNHRGWKYLTEHGRRCTGRIDRYQDSSLALWGATIPTPFAALLAITSRDAGATALSVAYTGMNFEGEEVEIGRQGLEWGIPYTSLSVVLS